jgi:hypothetical protein
MSPFFNDHLLIGAQQEQKDLERQEDFSHVIKEVLWVAEEELACLDPLLKDFRNLLGPRVGGYGDSLDRLTIELYKPAF